jgi:hypothetical protein
VGDQPDRAAGLDGTQLLVIADQPHIGAAAQGVADDLVQGVGARHGGLVDDQDELMLGETELQGGGDLVQSVWGGVDGLAKFLGGAAREYRVGTPSLTAPGPSKFSTSAPAGCLPLTAASAVSPSAQKIPVPLCSFAQRAMLCRAAAGLFDA